jgi:hypothetical protein
MRLSTFIRSGFICLSLFWATRNNASAQNSFNSKFEKIVFGCYARDIKEFEEFAIRAKKSGATHINLSNEDLPFAKWEYDTENDPYPSWVFTNMGLLKIATPAALKPYLPQDYAEKVLSIIEERCKVLRKYGLKAAFRTFEPQMLPEKVYTDHPLWRGPRVDHPSRSRVARWAPDIDNPEVLKLYYEAMTILLKRCPEIEILSLTTNDSATGLSWSGGLYSGATGNTFNKYRRMDDRIFSFFSVLQESSERAGSNLEIDIFGTREYFPDRIAEKLSSGMAIENLEGPDGKPFKYEVGFVMDYYQAFYPVVGIPDPVQFVTDLENAGNRGAKRLFVLFGDRFNKDLYFTIYDSYNKQPANDLISRLQLLREVAEGIAGKQNSDLLLNIWVSLFEMRKPLNMSANGGYIFYLGTVMQRWITRPFVPFPEELKQADRQYYRKYLFQAKSEDNANDMADLQSNRIFSGYNGASLAARFLYEVSNSNSSARKSISEILQSDIPLNVKNDLELLDLRLQSVDLLCNNAHNALYYQAILDKVKAGKTEPDPKPLIGTPSEFTRSEMLETARREIDNTALLIQLLEPGRQVVLDIAASKDLEDIRRLGPDLVEQLKVKLRIMNEHWIDYNRIFSTPNL